MVTSVLGHGRSFVVQGAVSAEMFNTANMEHFAVYAKLRPFLSEIRTAASYPDYLLNLERVVQMVPKPEKRVAIFERYMTRQRGLAAEGKQQSVYPSATDGG
jgi:hypothetical protein